MATFPALTPSSRSFTPGLHPHSEIGTLNGLQTRVRTSNVILEQRLRLTFLALTEAQMLSIRTHYLEQQGRFLSFDIPDDLLSGMSAPDSFTPTDHSWIYAGQPQVIDVACGRHDVSVELATVPPEGANINGAEFTVGVSIAAGAATSSISNAGFDLTVTALLAAGAGTGTANAAGFDLTVNSSLEPGEYGGDVEFAASGSNIAVDILFEAGVASGENYQVFLSSGTWDWSAADSPSTVDVLLVGGGGGGGAWRGGGGGAGGVRVATAVSVTGNTSVTVGAGGNGNTAGSTPTAAQTGGLSSFGAQQAAGGGLGGIGQNSNNAGGNGGSGGGAGGAAASGAQSAGTGTSGQGSSGGSSFNVDTPGTDRAGGGGGGKGAAGQNATVGAGGNGGNGVTLASLGFDNAVALGAPSVVGGGGGGSSDSGTIGTGGSGGGGGGNRTGDASNGVANTGGGGGGAGGGAFSANKGGNGGSGLVIVRWLSS